MALEDKDPCPQCQRISSGEGKLPRYKCIFKNIKKPEDMEIGAKAGCEAQKRTRALFQLFHKGTTEEEEK